MVLDATSIWKIDNISCTTTVIAITARIQSKVQVDWASNKRCCWSGQARATASSVWLGQELDLQVDGDCRQTTDSLVYGNLTLGAILFRAGRIFTYTPPTPTTLCVSHAQMHKIGAIVRWHVM
jgi:hypothetical protein